jgi:hypothetical protein
VLRCWEGGSYKESGMFMCIWIMDFWFIEALSCQLFMSIRCNDVQASEQQNAMLSETLVHAMTLNMHPTQPTTP